MVTTPIKRPSIHYESRALLTTQASASALPIRRKSSFSKMSTDSKRAEVLERPRLNSSEKSPTKLVRQSSLTPMDKKDRDQQRKAKEIEA
jgi:hypothetical protein